MALGGGHFAGGWVAYLAAQRQCLNVGCNYMTHRTIYILTCLLVSVLSSGGQSIGKIKVDTTKCGDEYDKLRLFDKKVMSALSVAESYIRAIVGDKIIESNIVLDYCESRETGFVVYSKDIQNIQTLGEDTCYTLQYFVLDKTDTIGYFQLLIDRTGKLVQDYNGPKWYNHPELIRGFKNHFDKRLKFTYSQALELGKKKGFFVKPYLQCETESGSKNLISNGGDIFIKVKYYWSFFQKWNGGDQASLDINAETGQVENERYVPRLPFK